MKDKVDSIVGILSNLDVELNTEKNRLESIENQLQAQIQQSTK
jgi:hypothetical protein